MMELLIGAQNLIYQKRYDTVSELIRGIRMGSEDLLQARPLLEIGADVIEELSRVTPELYVRRARSSVADLLSLTRVTLRSCTSHLPPRPLSSTTLCPPSVCRTQI